MNQPVQPNRRALSATEIVTQLSKLNGEQALGWRLMDGALEKTFAFKNFHETMAFVNALAFIAHAEDHHPDLSLSYSKCTVRFNTHDVNGISASDFLCASKVDALLL
jgi:4a-hydroxytetrahydrobiopterin dehydratase